MSTIAGIFQLDGASVDRSRSKTLAGSLPENRGKCWSIWEGDSIGLVYESASTANSVNDQQPLVDPASGCVITFEGRLDNRDELSPALADYRRLIDRKIAFLCFHAIGERTRCSLESEVKIDDLGIVHSRTSG